MIKSFKCKVTEKVYCGYYCTKLPVNIQKTARRKLDYLDVAKSLNDLKVPPGNKLEALKGNRKLQYSIRINDQWRICFKWDNNSAFDVEIVDYH